MSCVVLNNKKKKHLTQVKQSKLGVDSRTNMFHDRLLTWFEARGHEQKGKHIAEVEPLEISRLTPENYFSWSLYTSEKSEFHAQGSRHVS